MEQEKNILDEIDPADLEEGLLKRAKNRAMYILAARPCSSKGLYNKLIKNYPDEICTDVVRLMTEYGFLDDEVYAKKLAHYLIKKKQLGIYKARYDMSVKGLDRTIIDEALAEYDSQDMQDEITRIIEKKYADSLDTGKDVQRVMNALARRGYSFDDIRSCISAFRENSDDLYYGD